MFKKLLFTDKCILNTDTNTVIFDFEEDWKEYTKWSQDNIESEYQIQQDKQAELSWNQGAVHKRGSEDRIFHKSGHIFDYKKYSISGSLIIHNKYFYNGNVMSTYRKRGYLEIKETYIDNGSKGSSINSKVFTNNGTERKSIKYYPNSNIVQTQIKRLSIEFQIFNDYYDNGVLRAQGMLNMQNKMTGNWSFYSRDKIIESTHTFDKGKLIEKSYLYNQLGEFTKSVYHG